MRHFKILGLAAVLWLLALAPAWGQDSATSVIIPVPPRTPKPVPVRAFVLEKIGLEATVDGQKVSCTLKYVLFNPGSSPLEVDFLAPLPDGGTVTGLTLLNGQTEMPGQIYDKDEAWKIYRDIVAKRRDPALLEYAGRDTFRARVFPVEPGQRQTLELNFDYLAPKTDGQISLSFPLAGPLTLGQTPEQDIQVRIKDAPGLGGLYSPLAGVKIEQERGRAATAVLTSPSGPVIDRFRLYFQTDSGPLGGLILSHKPDQGDDGFFLLMAEPELSADDREAAAKNIIFVLDKSGSMNGPKFAQAKQALEFILERLEDRDSFGLIDYNAKASAWKPELEQMNQGNRDSARAYVKNLRSGGATNIEEALTTAFTLLAGDPESPNYLIFLTDGQPTAGQTDEMQLAATAKSLGRGVRLFAFGVGFDVNARLLDRLSGQAGGSSVFVKPDENLEEKVSAFFTRLTSPALTNPALTSSRPLNRLLPEEMPDLFAGQQMIVVGRYPEGGPATLTLAGRQGDKTETYEFKADLASGPAVDGQFIASIWAQRRIGDLIDQIDLAGGKPNQELVDELVQLSKKYGILTPYTSFLALEDQAITQSADLVSRAADNLAIIEETVGASANMQRAIKGEMKMAASAPMPRNMAADSQDQMLYMARFDQTVQKAQGRERLNQPGQWAGQTFYFKEGRWQAENLTDKDLKNLKPVRQLSDEYFVLAKDLGPEEMVWLTQSEPVVFKHQGISYLIEPVE